MLKGKKILLGVTGSIAAYKAAELIRLLIKAEAEVKVIMTSASAHFITPLTLSTLSKKPIYTTFDKSSTTGEWNNHVELALWADIFLIAPLSANTLAKMATGICDNLLLATYFSAKCSVYVAPAMDLDMYKHHTVTENIKKLNQNGIHIIESEFGELASGLHGEGRMAEPVNLVNELKSHFKKTQRLKGKKIMVTAGPTYEPIDPVRFIGNHSSGKMGYAIAEECAKEGAEVMLISGPTSLNVKNKTIQLKNVNSAEEMYHEVMNEFTTCDIVIKAAAVADFTPKNTENQKIKKSDKYSQITLKPTTDILLELGKIKQKNQVLIGFALETNNEEENAIKKIKNKNLDFIVLNSLADNGAGFKNDTNKITIIHKNKSIKKFELKSKKEVAEDIIEEILTLY